MAIIHVVLTKLDGKQPASLLPKLKEAAQGMVGQIPGLKRCDVGPPLESTKWRSQGWDLMLFAELESEQALEVYATHAVHEQYKENTKPYNVDVLAFDIVSDV
ncbi:hypothetical protein JCM10207_002974 [Rhodosporidiobolus poonsookiae]